MKKILKHGHLFAFLAPTVIVATLLIIIPLLTTIFYSFTNLDTVTVNYDAATVERVINEQSYYYEFSKAVAEVEESYRQTLALIPAGELLNEESPYYEQYRKLYTEKEAALKEVEDRFMGQQLFSKEEIADIKEKLAEKTGYSGKQLNDELEKELKKLKSRRLTIKLNSFLYQVSSGERPVTISMDYLKLSPTGSAGELLIISNSIYEKIDEAIRTSKANIERERSKQGVKFVGIKNYIEVFSSSSGEGSAEFFKILLQTIIWTISCVVVNSIIGLYLAILLNRNVKGNIIYRVLLMIPWTIPQFVAAISWRFLYWKENGIINEIFRRIGMGEINFLGDSSWLLTSCIIVNIWLGIPFMMITLLGALQSVDDSLYEAAEIDGANRWQSFLNITLPGIKKIASVTILLNIIWTFNAFAVIYLVTLGNNSTSKDILVTYAFDKFNSGLYNIASLYAVIILLVLVMFGVIYIRMLEREEKI